WSESSLDSAIHSRLELKTCFPQSDFVNETFDKSDFAQSIGNSPRAACKHCCHQAATDASAGASKRCWESERIDGSKTITSIGKATSITLVRVASNAR